MTRLWREVFGEPPPLADDPALLTRVLVENLPPAPPYQPLDLRAFTRPAPASRPADDEPDQDEEALRA